MLDDHLVTPVVYHLKGGFTFVLAEPHTRLCRTSEGNSPLSTHAGQEVAELSYRIEEEWAQLPFPLSFPLISSHFLSVPQ